MKFDILLSMENIMLHRMYAEDSPFTMTPDMVADATLTLRPRILYPNHYQGTNPQELVKLLKDEQEIEVRIRDLW